MKTLALVRHAKSSWDHADLDDHDRPLNDRGRTDAPRMAARLAATDFVPAVILSSTAVRAASTAQAFADALGVPVEHDARLYGVAPAELLRIVDERDVDSILVVAHDPGLSSLAQHFSGFPDGDAIPHMPTCAVAVFDFDVDAWADVRDARPVHWSYDIPRPS
jgi:phosphohistidine phosphatase